MATQQNKIIYYILFPKDTEEDCIKDINQLGTVERRKKFTDGKYIFYNEFVFVKNDGFKILEAVINHKPDKLDKVRIKTSTGRNLTIEQFFDRIETCVEIK